MSGGDDKASIKTALISAASAILVALIGFWGVKLNSKNSAPQSFPFVGIITSKSGGPISNALIQSLIDENVPQSTRSDSNGVFHLAIPNTASSLRIFVSADGYEKYDVDANPHRTGPEPIELSPISEVSHRDLKKQGPDPPLAPRANLADVDALKFEIDGRVKAIEGALNRISGTNWVEDASTNRLSTAWAGSALNMVPLNLDHGPDSSSQFRDTPFLDLLLQLKAKSPNYPQDSIGRSIKAYNDIREFCSKMPSYDVRDDPNRRLSPQQIRDAVGKLREDTKSLAP